MRKKTGKAELAGAGIPAEDRLVLPVIVITITLFSLFIAFVVQMPRLNVLEVAIYIALLSGLAYCCLSYEFNRLGTARRRRRHKRFTQAELSYLLDKGAPEIAVLIPSYREERRVLQMTILSAALAQYSRRRIVVLVDDPPGDHASLRATRAAVDDVARMLREPMAPLEAEYEAWKQRLETGKFLANAEKERLAKGYRAAAQWLEDLARSLRSQASEAFRHVDQFVADKVVDELAGHYRGHAKRLASGGLDRAAAEREYSRLASLFCTDIERFERKSFANLSHAPNKASNLNSYIGLLGGCHKFVARDGATFVEGGTADDHDLAVPGADYVLTLDADSVIVHDYILNLAHVLRQNPTVGVAQTPYLTFPNASKAVERIAGATTDIQYLVHQGSTYFNASYWVGANALIRHRALQDIASEHREGEKTVRSFIQDTTVIEDTGSTIDLLREGWSVYNYFVPLAYSATPADFGALAIQRKRWSNGGLIIFPMLLRQYLANRTMPGALPELALRSNYLLSPLIGNLSIFLLMIWASSDGRALMWAPMIMAPYFVLYGLDLRRLGYRFVDIFGVCALNLMLLPVSFAGIIASIVQMITGRKGRFTRTPKVSNRTIIPPYGFLFNVAMMALMVFYVWEAVDYEEYWGALVPLVNVVLYGYGLYRFVGVGSALEDIFYTLRDGAKAAAARLAPRRRRADALLPAFFGNRRFALNASAVAAFLAVMTPATLMSGLSTQQAIGGAAAYDGGTVSQAAFEAGAVPHLEAVADGPCAARAPIAGCDEVGTALPSPCGKEPLIEIREALDGDC